MLSLDGRNLVAAEALIPLYEKGNDVGALARCLSVQLDLTPGGDERQERMQRLAALLSNDASDPASALPGDPAGILRGSDA